MAKKYQNKYRIESARLQNWDYRREGAYFITICTQNRKHYFGKIKNGKMEFSNIGIIADILWSEIINHNDDIELGEFVVMPNHIHGILILNNNTVVVETLHATSLRVICEPVPTHDMKKVAGMAKALSEKNVDVVAMFTEDGGIAIATQKGGVNAREIFEKIKEFAGGNGGGSPFFVQGKGVELENFQGIRAIVEGM